MLSFSRILVIILAFVFTTTMDSCKSRGPYNPYLKMKTSPGELQLKGDKRVTKKGNRAYKRQLGRNRKHLFGRRKAPGM